MTAAPKPFAPASKHLDPVFVRDIITSLCEGLSPPTQSVGTLNFAPKT